LDTVITGKNPFGYSRYGFAWEHVPQGAGVHLDFGCYNGAFLESLKSKGLEHLVGVDISKDAVAKAQQRLADHEIVHIHTTVPLSFEKARFTSITLMDVLEHVWEQEELLDELNRVLKDDGILIITVPGKHLFSFLDMGNFKFLFPKLHRWYICLKHSKQEYVLRYVSNPDGLIGDISAKKRWHEHFSRSYLAKLLNKSGFRVERFDGSGYFSRIIGGIGFLLKRFKPLHSFMIRLCLIDSKLFKSTNLFCVCRKINQ